MNLVSQAELKHFVAPLICDSNQDLLDVFVSAAFSHLCEPGDRSLHVFCQVISKHDLLQSLVSRESCSSFATRIGPSGVERLESDFGDSIERVWLEAGERWLPRVVKSEVLASLDQAKSLGAHLVTANSIFYPSGFVDLERSMPGVLWVLGNPALLTAHKLVSIVGSRSTSVYGRNTASDLAVVAADNQIVTVSGGAFGIDATVHQATMAAGGATIAAMAGGIARLYPASNRSMLEQVVATGAVISEVPPNTAPAKWRFLMRNRLIAALGQATVVVQAGHKSGSINTASAALELGRRVAVVPGPINSVYSAGCHKFLNQNLGLVELLASSDSLATLITNPSAKDLANEDDSFGLGVLETRALDAFMSGENRLEQILRESGLTSKEGFLALGSLELLGKIERFGAGYRKVAK